MATIPETIATGKPSENGAEKITRVSREGPAIADPAPLGLAAFALTTELLSAVNADKIHTGALTFVGVALFYGGQAQLLAGMWEYRKGNTFGATAFCSYAAFWISFGFLEVVDNVAKPTVPFLGHEGVIWFLFLWGVFTAYMWVTSFRTTGILAVTFGFLTITFAALWIGALHNDAAGIGWTGAGGWLGLATAALAGYASFAAVLNGTFGRTVLPTVPLTGGR